jgi:hypothetical protein
MKSKVRIVKRTYANRGVEYVIQRKCFWFFGGWEDAGPFYEDRPYRFSTLEEAQKHLYLHDGTRGFIDEVEWS